MENNEVREAFEDLYSLVQASEYPSLLNEDSGGDAELQVRIADILEKPAQARASTNTEMQKSLNSPIYDMPKIAKQDLFDAGVITVKEDK